MLARRAKLLFITHQYRYLMSIRLAIAPQVAGDPELRTTLVSNYQHLISSFLWHYKIATRKQVS